MTEEDLPVRAEAERDSRKKIRFFAVGRLADSDFWDSSSVECGELGSCYYGVDKTEAWANCKSTCFPEQILPHGINTPARRTSPSLQGPTLRSIRSQTMETSLDNALIIIKASLCIQHQPDHGPRAKGSGYFDLRTPQLIIFHQTPDSVVKGREGSWDSGLGIGLALAFWVLNSNSLTLLWKIDIFFEY